MRDYRHGTWLYRPARGEGRHGGPSLAECKALAEEARKHVGVYLTVETLEFLHRGGRIGGATRFLGTALNLKPILVVEGGRVEPVERVRTRGKALDRVVELVAEKCAGKSPVRMATLHADSEADAKVMLDKITPLVHLVESVFATISPAVGANTGPGTVGLAWMAGLREIRHPKTERAPPKQVKDGLVYVSQAKILPQEKSQILKGSRRQGCGHTSRGGGGDGEEQGSGEMREGKKLGGQEQFWVFNACLPARSTS